MSDHYQKPKPFSIHLQDFREPTDVWKALSVASVRQASLQPHEYKRMWGALKKARQKVNKELEEARQQGGIKSSLEAKLTLHVRTCGHAPAATTTDATDAGGGQPSDTGAALWELIGRERERARLERLDYDVLSEYFVVSQCDIVMETPSDREATRPATPETDGGGKQDKLRWLKVTVERMPGYKCPRCWRWTTTTHEDCLCASCYAAIGAKGSSLPMPQ